MNQLTATLQAGAGSLDAAKLLQSILAANEEPAIKAARLRQEAIAGAKHIDCDAPPADGSPHYTIMHLFAENTSKRVSGIPLESPAGEFCLVESEVGFRFYPANRWNGEWLPQNAIMRDLIARGVVTVYPPGKRPDVSRLDRVQLLAFARHCKSTNSPYYLRLIGKLIANERGLKNTSKLFTAWGMGEYLGGLEAHIPET